MRFYENLDIFGRLAEGLPLPTNLYSFIFYGALLYATLMTLALLYHWFRFSPGVIRTSLIMLIYLGGTGFLLLAAFGLMTTLL